MDKDPAKEKYSAPALSKGLDILELLATRSTGMKKSEIAKYLNRSVSEIFRMLAVLVDRRYVSVDPDNEKYALTLMMFEMAHKHPPIKRLTTVASEIMADLTVRTNQSMHLAILANANILVIAQNDPPGNNITSVRLGARIPILFTASGAVLTCQFSKTRLNELCEQSENASASQKKMFLVNVAQAAKTNICVSPSMVIAGVENISVPITDYSGQIIASLTTPFIKRLTATDDPDIKEVIVALSEAGKRISNLLGANATGENPQAIATASRDDR